MPTQVKLPFNAHAIFAYTDTSLQEIITVVANFHVPLQLYSLWLVSGLLKLLWQWARKEWYNFRQFALTAAVVAIAVHLQQYIFTAVAMDMTHRSDFLVIHGDIEKCVVDMFALLLVLPWPLFPEISAWLKNQFVGEVHGSYTTTKKPSSHRRLTATQIVSGDIMSRSSATQPYPSTVRGQQLPIATRVRRLDGTDIHLTQRN